MTDQFGSNYGVICRANLSLPSQSRLHEVANALSTAVLCASNQILTNLQHIHLPYTLAVAASNKTTLESESFP
jgi:hypothetical protein